MSDHDGLESVITIGWNAQIGRGSAYDHERGRPLKPGVGVVKSLKVIGSGPVVLVHIKKVRPQLRKPN
jgi:hypothetical protein